MKPGIPWSVKGIEPEVREAAKHAARKAGMTLGEWLNTVILDQSDEETGEMLASGDTLEKDFFETEAEAPAPRRDDTTVRLEDIAQQLSRLAQRERESATIMPYEVQRPRHQDNEALHRILNRIDSNERQAVEAFTAVNERLSVLGRQIAMTAKQPAAPAFQKPEDVPGFASLETAIRNVVEHIEISDKRTRDSLRTMQDRLAEMSQRATTANADDLVKTAPAFTSLEARMAEMAARLQRAESSQHTGLPEAVRKELNQLADRIETVRQASESLGAQAQTAATGIAQRELRDIEGRILGLLKDAQSAFGSQSTTASDLQRLRGDIGTLNKRIDEVGAHTASEHDVHALRVAVEQLSTRVAQGADMRPLADMDKRLGEITQRLEQNHAATRNLPQFGELERRIAELDHRLAEAVRLQGDGHAMAALEQQISAFGERLGRTEDQLGHLETMEQAIHQLYQGLEDSRAMVEKVADDAATRAADRVMAAHQVQAQTLSSEPSHELLALKDGLRAVRDSAANADQRNQETLEAVHETLEQIVSKLAELETSTAGHQFAANMAQQAMEAAPVQHQQAWSQPEPAAPAAAPASEPFFDPAGTFATPSFEPQAAPQLDFGTPAAPQPVMPEPVAAAPAAPMPDFTAGATVDFEPGDDFIAAARRAAQAAANRGSVLSPENKPSIKAGANSRFKFSLPFLRGEKAPKPITYVGGKPVVEESAKPVSSDKRRKLILAGIVLLAAVSAFTFNMMARTSKPAKQTSLIESPLSQSQMVDKLKTREMPVQALADQQAVPNHEPLSDTMVTGSLPARKTDASLSSLVAEPGVSSQAAEVPDEAVGNLALRDAAARGDAKAQFIIGSRYLDGQGVSQDLPKAAHWYQMSASNGLAPAQYRLATLFERGKGVPQDAATALLWYERAAQGGNIKAMHNAAVIAAGNQAGTPNYDKAFRWFKQAADRGLKDSQFNLAVLYERGLGTKIDKTEALMWYTLAGQQGDADAAKRGEQLAASLSGSDVQAAQSRVSSWTALPSADDANVVAITEASWNDPAAPAPQQVEDVASAAPANPVMQAQHLLTRLGFNVGEPDGKMGARTHNAIRLFQLQSGLKVNGEVTPELIEALRAKAG